MTRPLMHATLDEISPDVASQHGTEQARVDAILAALGEGAWSLPPIVVVESDGNGALVLDGHHRARAARARDEYRIPAYVVPRAEYQRVLDHYFAGEAPSRLSDLDQYIRITGRPYVR